MNIVDILKKEYIIPNLVSKDKPSVLREISKAFLYKHENIDPEAIFDVLMARENLGSTGIGEGIAIPHGKQPGLEEPLISVGRSLEGIPFDSMDGMPAHLFFAIVAPENSTGIHLKLLAKISRMLKDEEFRERLMKAETAEKIFKEIENKDASD
jgi:PTS system nitrogen regulatory IIA component